MKMITTKEDAVTAFALVVLTMAWVGGSVIDSQLPVQVAQSPYSQTLSPYLDLLRNDNSVLSPYHSFVRPRQQLRQSINQQATTLRQLRRTVAQPLGTVRTQQRLPTGRGGSFNNHSHFYNFK